jgi:hypothetical protein
VNFLSDNTAPVAPAILDAIVQANEGFATAYGDDHLTRSVEHRLAELFEREVAVFLVPTGTAANALAPAHLTPSWGEPCCVTPTRLASADTRSLSPARPSCATGASRSYATSQLANELTRAPYQPSTLATRKAKRRGLPGIPVGRQCPSGPRAPLNRASRKNITVTWRR